LHRAVKGRHGSARLAPERLPKEGKSEVVCDAGALVKISKDEQGVITRDVLTKHWTDCVDYWAVDFNYESRKKVIKVPKGAGVNVVQGSLPGRYTVAVKVIDIFGNDTMTLMPVTVG